MDETCNDSALTNYILAGTDRKALWNQAIEIASDQFRKNPDLFNTNVPYIPYELRYVPPFDKDFSELKRIQVLAASAAYLFYEYKGFMIIDLTQYIGHESDYYFDVSLKFFRDMTSEWSFIFVLNKEIRVTRRMVETIAGFFCDTSLRCMDLGHRKTGLTSDGANRANQSSECSETAMQLLKQLSDSKLLSEPQMQIVFKETVRDYGKLTVSSLDQYLNDPASTLHMLMTDTQYDALVSEINKRTKEDEKSKAI